MPPAPLVSVLLAVSNGERYLQAALESVLRQTTPDFELLVVDEIGRASCRERVL